MSDTLPEDTPAWKRAALPLLGKMTDVELAKQVGVAKHKITRLRKSMNIEALCKTRWRGTVSRKIGVVSDRDLAQELNVAVSTVKRQRQSRELRHERYGMPPEALALLGKITDAEMARKFGRSDTTTRGWRVSRGIKAKVERREWTAKEIKLLGTMPDAEVARLVSRRCGHVRFKREHLNIPEYQPPAK